MGDLKMFPSLSPLPRWGRVRVRGKAISFPLPLLKEEIL
jgi:hypothetical protein